MQNLFKWVILGCLLLLCACSQATVDGELRVKVNADGSGNYQFKILTHPAALKYFEAYQEQLKENQFQIKPITQDQLKGWQASKEVKNFTQESLPLSVPTSSIPSMDKVVKQEKGFYYTTIHVNYPLDLTQITQESPLITLIQDRIHLRLNVSLPIAFEEQNATSLSKDKKTATWQLKVGEINPLKAKVTVPNPTGWIITFVGGGVLCLLLIVLAIWLWKRKKRGEV